jgi:hypothetical protein
MPGKAEKEALLFMNPLRAALVGAAVITRLFGTTRPAPNVSLDDLQSRLRELATASDEDAIRERLGDVVTGLDAQAPLVDRPFEVTYLWLIAKLQTLGTALEEETDTDHVIRTVNSLATTLADALDA